MIKYVNNSNKRKIKFSLFGETSPETIEIEKKYFNNNSKSSIKKFGLSKIEDIDFTKFVAFISFSRSEAQPLVPLEIASLKIPLLLSNIESHKNIFNSNSAIFFNNEDPSSIENAINKFFLLSPVERKEMIDNAYKIVETGFSFQVYKDNINRVFFS